MKEVNIEYALSNLTKPESVVFVISCNDHGVANIMPAGWSMRTSFNPPLYAVSIGFSRYTHELILKTKKFVIAFPSEELEKLILQTGSCSGRNMNKFNEFKIETVPSKETSPLPLLAKATLNLECKLHSQFETGDHTIFVGTVLRATQGKGKHNLINIGNYKFVTIRR